MPNKTWIVLVKASRARVCERHEGESGDGLHDLMDFVHTQSRQKGKQLGFDQMAG